MDFRNVEAIRQQCYEIHAFGLGFIQIKLTPQSRLHLYTSAVRVTTEPEDVHDHRYGFTSTILQGAITNDIFHVDPGGKDFTISEVTCKPGESGEDRPLFNCGVTYLGSFTMTEGSIYTLAADTYHRVHALEGTVTFLRRDDPFKEFARVARQKDQALVCPFSANVFSEDELWSIYEKAVRGGF